MLVLNLQNIEEIIFLNKDIHPLLPNLRPAIEQWYMSQRLPALRSLRLNSLMDVLNGLNEDNLQVLTDFFQEQVITEKIDKNIIKNETFSLKDVKLNTSFANFTISRDKEQLHITYWR